MVFGLQLRLGSYLEAIPIERAGFSFLTALQRLRLPRARGGNFLSRAQLTYLQEDVE